ncbi:hypothetical protein V8E53_003019 [Lactarius tabidus]
MGQEGLKTRRMGKEPCAAQPLPWTWAWEAHIGLGTLVWITSSVRWVKPWLSSKLRVWQRKDKTRDTTPVAAQARQFKRDFQPLDIIRKCGYEERTILHILFDCPLFQHARDEARIDNDRLHPTIYNLFSTVDGAQQLFQFLERAPAVHKPSKSPWLPGVPRIDPHNDRWYWDDRTIVLHVDTHAVTVLVHAGLEPHRAESAQLVSFKGPGT